MLHFSRVCIIAGLLLTPAASATLVVSNLGGGQLRLYDNSGNPIGGPLSGGGEGLACVTGTTNALFVANNTAVIHVLDPATLLSIGSGSVTITGGSQVAALALNQAGTTLYAADYGANKIFALDTATLVAAATGSGTIAPAYSVSTFASHDVAVDANGLVYTSHFQNGSLGVQVYSATLAPLGNFISPASASAVGLTHPAGMLFALGAFWISNFRATPCNINPADCGAVFEFDLSGNFIRKVNTAVNDDPIGLALGPGDGNIYVAQLGTDSIGKIDAANATYALTTFISNAGTQPKYLHFNENCVNLAPASPTPAFSAVALALLVLFLAALGILRFGTS